MVCDPADRLGHGRRHRWSPLAALQAVPASSSSTDLLGVQLLAATSRRDGRPSFSRLSVFRRAAEYSCCASSARALPSRCAPRRARRPCCARMPGRPRCRAARRACSRRRPATRRARHARRPRVRRSRGGRRWLREAARGLVLLQPTQTQQPVQCESSCHAHAPNSRLSRRQSGPGVIGGRLIAHALLQEGVDLALVVDGGVDQRVRAAAVGADVEQVLWPAAGGEGAAQRRGLLAALGGGHPAGHAGDRAERVDRRGSARRRRACGPAPRARPGSSARSRRSVRCGRRRRRAPCRCR